MLTTILVALASMFLALAAASVLGRGPATPSPDLHEQTHW